MNIFIYNYTVGSGIMKHVTILEYDDDSAIKEKVNQWIAENESSILEIIDIEYIENGNMYIATITYEERE